MKKTITLIMALAFVVGLMTIGGCKKDEEAKNQNPVVTSVLVQPGSVSPGGSAVINVTASDPDGDELTYTYAPSGGTVAGNGASATWTAPTAPGAYSVIVTVNDGKGGTATGNGALTVTQPVTTIAGTARFPAGVSGDLSNAKVSIYTSWDNWNANQPVRYVAATGSGSTVSFSMVDVAPGNYYLDIWKDNDNDSWWSSGDYVGWYGSGGLGSPSLTEFQIAQGETKNFTVDMYILAKSSSKTKTE